MFVAFAIHVLGRKAHCFPFPLSFDILFLKLTLKWRHVISSHIVEITTRNEKFNSILVQCPPYELNAFLFLV